MLSASVQLLEEGRDTSHVEREGQAAESTEERTGVGLLNEEEDGEEEEDDGEDWINPEGFPLLFYGVEGKDVCDDDTPSFYNPAEALVVLQVVTKLLLMKELNVGTDEIGIIAPYRKQVQKIRLLLRKEGMGAIR